MFMSTFRCTLLLFKESRWLSHLPIISPNPEHVIGARNAPYIDHRDAHSDLYRSLQEVWHLAVGIA